MAAAAASAPAQTATKVGVEDDKDIMDEPGDEEELDEVAKLQAMMEEQNAEWQK